MRDQLRPVVGRAERHNVAGMNLRRGELLLEHEVADVQRRLHRAGEHRERAAADDERPDQRKREPDDDPDRSAAAQPPQSEQRPALARREPGNGDRPDAHRFCASHVKDAVPESPCAAVAFCSVTANR